MCCVEDEHARVVLFTCDHATIVFAQVAGEGS